MVACTNDWPHVDQDDDEEIPFAQSVVDSLVHSKWAATRFRLQLGATGVLNDLVHL
jgi:hypothetical protein